MTEVSPAPAPDAVKERGVSFYISALGQWAGRNPLQAVLLAALIGTLVYFFGFVPLFVNASQSAARWAWTAYGTEAGHSEHAHCKLVPFISLFLVWYHREKIRAATKQGSNGGLFWVALGMLSFVLSVRCLQPRLALAALPILVYGSVLYLWGKQVSRVILFPCAFMIFTIPFAALEQATFRLQFVVTGMVSFLSNLVGIGIQTVGTSITATDGSFNFEIAEGCSGIKSLIAMAMLTTVFVHLTQDRLWKKILILAFSAVFAIIGNGGRIFTVIVVAKFYDPKFASGIYHDYSGFVFFPIALAAMLGFSKLINMDFKSVAKPLQKGQGPGDQTSYDY